MVKVKIFRYVDEEEYFNRFFKNKKNKFIDLKFTSEGKWLVIYEEIEEEEVQDIKKFIIETVHEEVKSIRDIYQSFIELKK